MKKIVLLLAICLSAGLMNAQDVVKNKFLPSGNLIEATLYHQNGAIAQTGFYTKENKLQGEWISYDLLGNKTAIAQYNQGKKVGTWFFYEGDVMKEVNYDNFKITAVKTWEVKDSRMVSN